MMTKKTFIQEASLVGGPQDGAKVHAVGGWLPEIVYVGSCPLGDGYSAWSSERCKLFPCCYVLDAYKYKYKGHVNRGSVSRPLTALLAALLLSLPAYAEPPQILVAPGGKVIGRIIPDPMRMMARASAEPPLAQSEVGIIVPGRKAPAPPILANIVQCPAGRFVPLIPADGSPSYLAPNPAYRIYVVKPGSTYFGVIYNATTDEQEAYSWPEIKTPVYVLQSRSIGGAFAVQFLRNGSAEVGPVPNGPPLTIEILGPRPPPTPVPPTPPTPTDPLSAVIQAAYSSDPSTSKAADVKSLAVVYRMTASPTTMAVIVTDTDLYTLVKGRADSAIGSRLRSVRDVLGAELTKIEVPGSTARTLTAADKAAVVDLLTRFSTALEGVK